MSATYKKRSRKILWNISSHYCAICDRLMTVKGCSTADNFATIDHIIPKSKGGTNNYENLRLICRKCNMTRGSDIEPEIMSYVDYTGHYINVKGELNEKIN